MEKLILKGVAFDRVFASSGTLNFYGDGWPYHRLYKFWFKDKFDFTGATFISKTTTWSPREGNMPLDENLMPKEWFPKCIKVYFLKNVMLNAVGLSGPGAIELFRRGHWQKRTKPFMISFMSLGETVEEKVREAEQFVDLLLPILDDFKTQIGVQVNGSCPNTKHATRDSFENSLAILQPFRRLEVPIDYKIGIADAIRAGIGSIKEIESSGLAECLTCSNTVKWGDLPELINWQILFGTRISPLQKFGGGGLSGEPLKMIVENWLKEVRSEGVIMPIKAGGGILGPRDAIDFRKAGASAIELGCISTLRPYRVKDTIFAGNNYYGGHEDYNENI